MYRKLLQRMLPIALFVIMAVQGNNPVLAADTNMAAQAGTDAAAISDKPRLPSSAFIEDRHDVNVQFRAVYSSGLKQGSNDWFCITCRRKLNADEDPETEAVCHVDLNAAAGLRGYMEPGWYDVIGINYHGDNASLMDRKAAVSALIRVYSDQTVQIPVAIGEQAVKQLQEQSAVYIEPQGASEYTVDSSVSGIEQESENPESVFTDLSVFGSDIEARQRYLDYLKERGLVDENYQYTEEAEAVIKALDDQPEPASSEALAEDKESAAFNSAEDTGGKEENSGSYGSQEVKERRFDEEDQNTGTAKESSHPFLAIIIRFLPILVISSGIVTALIWYRKK